MEFSRIRKSAETNARSRIALDNPGFQEVTLDEIYAEVKTLSKFNDEVIEFIKNEELQLELQYCSARRSGMDLFLLAKYLNKKILIITDMYLPVETIQEILKTNGYEGYERLYVSSFTRKNKTSGDIYRYAINEMGFNAQEVVHIGDNYDKDILSPKKLGWAARHLPKATTVFTGGKRGISSGYFYKRIYKNNKFISHEAGLRFFGIRCMLGVIANRMFDNPFVNFDPDTDFDTNPMFIGYFPLGMYVYSIARWLEDECKDFDALHFVSRDGWLVQQAYRILPENVRIHDDYIYFSRKATIPMLIQDRMDLLSLFNILEYSNLTPKTLYTSLSPLTEITEAEFFELIGKENAHGDLNFSSEDEFLEFLHLFIEFAYSKDKAEKYSDLMRLYFADFFKDKKTAVFDVGYSGRLESLLTNLYGYRITAYHIHINNVIAKIRSHKSNFSIKTLFPYSPAITGPVREFCMSETASTCLGFSSDDAKTVPVFETFKSSYQATSVAKTLHNGALDFVHDMEATFKNDRKFLFFRSFDGCLPFEVFLTECSQGDADIFSVIQFEDDLFLGGSINAKDFLLKQQRRTSRIVHETTKQTKETPRISDLADRKEFSIDGTYIAIPKWKQAVCLYFLDKKRLFDDASPKSFVTKVLRCFSINKSKNSFLSLEQKFMCLSNIKKAILLSLIDRKRLKRALARRFF